MEDVFGAFEWNKKGMKIQGKFCGRRSAYSQDIKDLQSMLEEVKLKLEEIWLTMNFHKTKIMTSENIKICLRNQVSEKVEEYTNMGHTIKLDKENQSGDIYRRIRLTWGPTEKSSGILKNKNFPINRKRKVFDT